MLRFPEITQDKEDKLYQQTSRQVSEVAELYWTLHKDICNIELSGIYWTIWIEFGFSAELTDDVSQVEVDVVMGPYSFGVAAPLSIWWPFAGHPYADKGWDDYQQYMYEVGLKTREFVHNWVVLHNSMALLKEVKDD